MNNETEKNDITEADINKDVLIGYAIVKGVYEKQYIYKVPIVGWWEEFDDDSIDLEDDDEVIGVITAIPGSYKVSGVDSDGRTLIALGYEFPGAYHPDWIEELKLRRKANALSSQK